MDKHFAYLVGFFWADGMIESKYNYVSCETTLEDSLVVREIFTLAGIPFGISERSRPNRQPQGTIRPHCKEFTDCLVKLGFCSHRKHSPDITGLIPDDLIRYFFLGFSDGDGCFYWNEKWSLRQFSFTGLVEQDWSFISSFLESKNITSSVRRIRNTNSYSQVRATGKPNLTKVAELLYPNSFEFGFERKYKKLKLCL